MPDFNDDIESCLAALRRGGTVLYSVPGGWEMACDALHPEAICEVQAASQLPGYRGAAVLLAEPSDLLQYVAALDLELLETVEEESEPVGRIYENVVGLPDELLDAAGRSTIRVVKGVFCKTLIKRLRRPLFAVALSGPLPSNKTDYVAA